MRGNNMRETTEFEELQKEFEKTMHRLQKCAEIPEADLRSRYAKSYKDLRDKAKAQANTMLRAMVYGGFAVGSGIDQRELCHKVAEYTGSSVGAAALQAASNAQASGDIDAFYAAVRTIRRAVREIATPYGLTEDLIYRMAVEGDIA